MGVYRNRNTNEALTAVEFSNTPEGQHVVFHLRDDAGAAAFKERLNGSGLGVRVVAQTHVNGETLLVGEATNIQEPLTMWLGSQGSQLELTHVQKPMDPWVIRSILGFGGQTLQLASSFMRPSGKVDISVFVFAAANMAASGINMIYKGHDLDDPHHLKFLKERYNQALTPHFQQGQLAPGTDDSRKALRDCGDQKKDTFNDFMKQHSVNVGELGLRYLGAFGMAFPATGWHHVFKGHLPPTNTHMLRTYAGLGSMAGKTIALGSKVEDPYNPEPKSWLDPIREKFTFVGGGLVEATAFGALAYDCFFNTGKKEADLSKDKGIMFRGQHHRDWLGGVGASMFVLGYIVRSWAKYGERNVDMEELYAHVSDTLAKVKPDQLPQLLADTAADIKTHFKDKADLDYSTIYTALANDLKRYHHIDVANLLNKQSDAPATKVDAGTVEPVQELPVKQSHHVKLIS